MGVGSVTKSELLSSFSEESLLVFGGGGDRVGRGVLASEVVGDSGIVGSSVREGLLSKRKQSGQLEMEYRGSFV